MITDRTSPNWARRIAHIAFGFFIFLVLATSSLRVGPFTWLPVLRFSMLAGRPADIGLLSLLPIVIVAGWLVSHRLDQDRRQWNWGRAGITLPLLGLTLLILTSLDPALTWRTAVQVVGTGLTWLIYLFVLNEKPNLTLPLALVVLVQGSVALGQFLLQRDIGLSALGELSLDRELSGIIVLWARDQRWLRAYGLTGHPNVLGATMAVLLLLLLPELHRARGWERIGLTAAVCAGLLGLLTSFSRAAWLAFGIGLLAWSIQMGKRRYQETGCLWRNALQRRLSVSDLRLHFILPLLVAAIFLFFYRDLVISRFLGLNTPIEARSLNDRGTDVNLALRLIAAHPRWGVGAGNYLPAVRALEPYSRVVHNVPLLVAAELGLVGAALWAWLSLSGLRSPILPVWLATLIASLFDVGLWMTAGWRSAVVLALLLGLSGSRRDRLSS